MKWCLLRCMSPVMAQSGHPATAVWSPLLGERTSKFKSVTSACDPKRTLAGVLCCSAKRVSALSKHLLEPVRCSLLGSWRVAL
jgi:hypothetical protein